MSYLDPIFYIFNYIEALKRTLNHEDSSRRLNMSLKFYNLILNAFIKRDDPKRRSKNLKKGGYCIFFSLWSPHGLFVKLSGVFTCRLFVYLLNSTLKRIKYLTFILALTFSFTFALTFSFTFAFVLLIVYYFSD